MKKRRMSDLLWMLRVAFNDWRRGVTPGHVMTHEVRTGGLWLEQPPTTTAAPIYISNLTTTYGFSTNNPYR